MKPTYEQALADRDYLFNTYGPASDMTGGWVEGDHFEELLKRPSKAKARDILSGLICYWFETGHDGRNCYDTTAPNMSDPKVAEIAERYNPAYIAS